MLAGMVCRPEPKAGQVPKGLRVGDGEQAGETIYLDLVAEGVMKLNVHSQTASLDSEKRTAGRYVLADGAPCSGRNTRAAARPNKTARRFFVGR